VRNLPVGAGEAVMLKSHRRHNTATTGDSEWMACGKVLKNKARPG